MLHSNAPLQVRPPLLSYHLCPGTGLYQSVRLAIFFGWPNSMRVSRKGQLGAKLPLSACPPTDSSLQNVSAQCSTGWPPTTAVSVRVYSHYPNARRLLTSWSAVAATHFLHPTFTLHPFDPVSPTMWIVSHSNDIIQKIHKNGEIKVVITPDYKVSLPLRISYFVANLVFCHCRGALSPSNALRSASGRLHEIWSSFILSPHPLSNLVRPTFTKPC